MKLILGLVVVLNLAATVKPSPQTRFFCIHSSDTIYKETTTSDMSKNLDFKLDFAFLVHGWGSLFNVSDEGGTPYKIGLAWVKEKKTNFCGIDWRELASDDYINAALKHVQTVGKQFAAFMLSLLKKSGKTADSISIAGHSLGAHVSGLAGQTIYESTKTKISTIYGLDAAAPTFYFKIPLIAKSNFSLSTDNANFVQVLHTTSALGTSKNIGHADFIANGGNVQGACLDEVLKAEDLLIKCSHSFAKDIFLASFTHWCTGYIENKNGTIYSWFLEFFSNSKSSESDVYGIHSKKKFGIFELETSNSEPYCEEK
ncbi:phospholipase A1 VesT1.02-like [Bradysia coprophila]|uniref:phospholipase A1 VesT1.02-like n=1 Tax=Bradysia coprophila TaxID=38358 RepID=UPI00187DD882|nr:phospholipase A1 VesT1.02-like [Bradysia coprophila]